MTFDKNGYFENLETFIHDPESVGFDQSIIPVAMWLRGYIPGEDEESFQNMTTRAIQTTMMQIVDVDMNTIARLMIMNGYSIGYNQGLNPMWLMQPLTEEELTAVMA